VKDLHWNHPLQVTCAIGKKLAIVDLKEDEGIKPSHISASDKTRAFLLFRLLTVFIFNVLAYLPAFHTDEIREIAVNLDNRIVLSGGFDGRVYLTDMVKLLNDIRCNLNESVNSNYETFEPVGSVRWHPFAPSLASLTTDGGTFHAFDIRANGPVIYQTGRKDLFTHCYRDVNTILLGYGDGTIGVLDVRFPVLYAVQLLFVLDLC